MICAVGGKAKAKRFCLTGIPSDRLLLLLLFVRRLSPFHSSPASALLAAVQGQGGHFSYWNQLRMNVRQPPQNGVDNCGV